MIKDDEEIRLMEKSARLNHQLMEWLPSILTAGNTEAGIAWSIEKFFREHGATENSFSPIVAKDAHAALPHYNPFEEAHGPTEITPNCHILVDVGARLGHYCSDQTRTFWVGDKPGNLGSRAYVRGCGICLLSQPDAGHLRSQAAEQLLLRSFP